MQNVIISFVMCVHLTAENSFAPNEQIFMKFDTQVFFENLSRKFEFH